MELLKKIVWHPLFFEFWLVFLVVWLFASDFMMPLSKWFCGAVGFIAFLRIIGYYVQKRRAQKGNPN